MEPEIKNEEARKQISSIADAEIVKGLRVPVKRTNHYHKKLKKAGKVYEPLYLKKILTDGDFKVILLSRDCHIDQLDLTQDQINEIAIVEKQVTLTSANLTNQQIFNRFQSTQQQQQPVCFPNSFQTAGHIAHYNLTPEQDRFRYVIGEITLMRCANIRTVVNKSQKLHNVYRTPALTLMAGDKDYLVRMKEVGITFQFDFEKVYWCSRLQKERDRLLDQIKPGQCLADLFCGVGPLAVRAAAKGAYVIANDLNPHCYQYLLGNAKLNAVEDRTICWNMCAREATKRIYSDHLTFAAPFRYPDHIYMNLPVDAIEFTDVFRDYYKLMKTEKMPMMHVNCFVVAESDEKSRPLIASRISSILPGFKQEDIRNMHHIKNVTVYMRMYCVSFLLAKHYQPDDPDEQIKDIVHKKQKVQ